tara:strand:- start:1027 stop:2142 length:1116 start_codon:yes stop_codon:yes gene_type:complete
MKRVLYFNNIFPLYRESIWKLLLRERKYRFEIFYSEKNFKNIKAFKKSKKDEFYNQLHSLNNFFINGRLIWQSNVIKTVMYSNFDIAIFLGEMTVISTWIAAIICRIRNKKVFFWSHGLYGNEPYLKKLIRILFLSLPNINILYENRAKKLLVDNGFRNQDLKVIYNSLNYDLQLKLFNRLQKQNKTPRLFENDLPIILFIGRLTPAKKIDILIDGVSIINKVTTKVNLLIIGEGPSLKNLKQISMKALSPQHYRFYGELFDEEIIANLIYQSDLCVSPGNVGLTAIHSLSYGTPVASHNDLKNQMPEVESIIEGVNGFLFEINNPEDLANKILDWLNNKTKSKKDIRRVVDEKYNPYFQKKIIDKIILNG